MVFLFQIFPFIYNFVVYNLGKIVAEVVVVGGGKGDRGGGRMRRWWCQQCAGDGADSFGFGLGGGEMGWLEKIIGFFSF